MNQSYFKALRWLVRQPEAKRPPKGKVPAHLRVAIKSHARYLSKVCPEFKYKLY